ncbi:MAG: SMP-30/gluconolactonase/LRE family protein [Xanthobacteraceae bacterium]
MLAADGKALLVAEQGTMHTPGAISRIKLADGTREVIVDSFEGKPFNSPNKVIRSSKGWIYFSDPDYGANQGFKPKPELPMAVYAHNPSTGTTHRLTTDVDRPHGLALSLDEKVLYIGDTDAIDGKRLYNPKKSHSILSGPLRRQTGWDRCRKYCPSRLAFLMASSLLHRQATFGSARATACDVTGRTVRSRRFYPAGGPVFNVTSHGNIVYSTADTAIWQTHISSD